MYAPPETRLLSVKASAHYSSLSRSFLYKAMKDGDLEYKKIGKRRVIERKSLDDYLCG